mmetsp:Transcript_92597/g.177792  ORF Transcript_92597/g.177792 Transcript_92597/m.177792 type:complete len:591 (-) Transcript_92597:59-1831(-)
MDRIGGPPPGRTWAEVEQLQGESREAPPMMPVMLRSKRARNSFRLGLDKAVQRLNARGAGIAPQAETSASSASRPAAAERAEASSTSRPAAAERVEASSASRSSAAAQEQQVHDDLRLRGEADSLGDEDENASKNPSAGPNSVGEDRAADPVATPPDQLSGRNAPNLAFYLSAAPDHASRGHAVEREKPAREDGSDRGDESLTGAPAGPASDERAPGPTAEGGAVVDVGTSHAPSSLRSGAWSKSQGPSGASHAPSAGRSGGRGKSRGRSAVGSGTAGAVEPTPAEEDAWEDLERLTIPALKERLKAAGLGLSGSKLKLVARLRDYCNDMRRVRENGARLQEQNTRQTTPAAGDIARRQTEPAAEEDKVQQAAQGCRDASNGHPPEGSAAPDHLGQQHVPASSAATDEPDSGDDVSMKDVDGVTVMSSADDVSMRDVESGDDDTARDDELQDGASEPQHAKAAESSAAASTTASSSMERKDDEQQLLQQLQDVLATTSAGVQLAPDQASPHAAPSASSAQPDAVSRESPGAEQAGPAQGAPLALDEASLLAPPSASSNPPEAVSGQSTGVQEAGAARGAPKRKATLRDVG